MRILLHYSPQNKVASFKYLLMTEEVWKGLIGLIKISVNHSNIYLKPDTKTNPYDIESRFMLHKVYLIYASTKIVCKRKLHQFVNRLMYPIEWK